MFAWGSTIHGELGLGGIEDEHVLTPRSLDWSAATKVVEAACGTNHTLLLTDDGKVYSCGSNDYGQLGHDQPRKRPLISEPVSGLDAYQITHVACGSTHSMALNQWGQVFTWGSDTNGQLGLQLSYETYQPIPKILKALATYHVIQIACGENHCVALTNSGELFAWGANNHGQLGIGTTTATEMNPTVIASLSGIPIAFVACGGNHTFVVSKSGAVFGWGKNTYGQLGLNDTTSRSYPCQLRTLRNIKVRYISCGFEFSTFLTSDGGVLTCGAGMYGQLGHGNTSNEILPRQVLELMGSTITQITCGRQHTLALVPSRGRIYSFGLGGAGQLGGKNPVNVSTPQVVLGPWISPSGSSTATTSKESLIVKRIFAGGDHCFAVVMKDSDSTPLYDCRIHLPFSQILTLDVELINTCVRTPAEGNVDLEMLSYIETTFKSLACFNGSFLLPNDEHYYCTSKHHGVDIGLAQNIFDMIARFENESLKDLIWNSITDDLLQKLSPSPPDVEVLRVYLTLPLYHEFCNPKQHLKLHKPFVNSVLKLLIQAKRVVTAWWSSVTSEYFEKMVINFKNAASYILGSQKVPDNRTAFYDASLVAMLEMLSLLNKLNHVSDGLKVPYDTFHINELGEVLDVRIDYVSWLTDSSNRFFLCNYPFIFDAQTKTVLLETDQRIQMQTAMNNAAHQAVFSMIFSPSNLHNITQFLVLNVTRENIVADAIRELSTISSTDLKKPLKVKFCGEEAEDAGGVRKEFFMLLLREILDPKYGMFKEYEETRSIWFSEDSYEDEINYFLIGIICGLAIYNYTIIDVPFPLALYKKLLKEPIQLSDLKGLSPAMANSLQSLLDYAHPDLEEVFSLNFEITREVYGEVKTIPLKPNGENISVTQENKEEYVDLYVHYIFDKSVAKHYEAFSSGFMKVCGGRVLELFHSHELMAVVVGNENYDWHALEEVAEYKNGYNSSDQTIRWFWEVIHDLPLADKKKFLLFLTGSDRIPIQGMKAIKIIIQPTNDEKFLPVAHTCFNLLDLPKYQTKERLKYKLIQAIQQTQGFSLV